MISWDFHHRHNNVCPYRQRQEIDQLRREKDEQKQGADKQKDQVDQLMGQVDLLLKQQALLLSQIEKGSNASKLQSSEASGLSQVFEDQSLSQQSNPNTTSPAGNDDSQSNLTGSMTSNTSLSHGVEPEASQQPKKRRTAESQRKGVGRK